MKHAARLTAALLALLMLVPAVVGCSDSSSTGSDTTAPSGNATTSPSETEAPETEPLYEPDSLPETMDFGDADVTILTWKSYAKEFNLEGESGDIVDDSLYKRVRTVEDRLNINLSLVEEAGDWSNRNNFIQFAAKSINTGDGAYDLVAHYSLAASIGAMQHLYQDLLDIPNLNLEKPWWPGDIVEATKINDKVYFTTGDVAPTVLYNIFGVYFNQQMLTDNSLESPYDLVNSGKWTFEKMQEMSLGVYSDLNSNQTADEGDRFGFVFQDIVHVDPFFYAAGLTIVGKNADGDYVLDESFGSEKTATWLQKMCTYLHNNDDVIVQPSGDNGIFPNGQSLFICANLQYAIGNLRNAEFNYGIVPLPKYDDAQDRYYSVVGMPYSMFTVPIDVKDPARAGALLESLASEAYRTFSPAIFETAFKVKYARDDKAGQMYDIIRDSLVYDVGRTFGDTINAFALFRNAVRDNNPNWASLYASSSKGYELMINQIVKKLG